MTEETKLWLKEQRFAEKICKFQLPLHKLSAVRRGSETQFNNRRSRVYRCVSKLYQFSPQVELTSSNGKIAEFLLK
jgi:hypothetical protein